MKGITTTLTVLIGILLCIIVFLIVTGAFGKGIPQDLANTTCTAIHNVFNWSTTGC